MVFYTVQSSDELLEKHDVCHLSREQRHLCARRICMKKIVKKIRC